MPDSRMRTLAVLAALTIWFGVSMPAAAGQSSSQASSFQLAAKVLIPKTATRRRSSTSIHEFRSPTGGKVLTNRPHRYRREDGFEEVHLDRISIPKGYTSVESLVHYYARHYGIDANLVFAVIMTESNFNPSAQSSAGACGLMQLMPATAVQMGVTNIFDPAQNIAGGTQYLSKMLTLFKGDKRLALAGYNAGPNAVKRYGGIPPFEETQNYVPTVLSWANKFAEKGFEAAKNTKSASSRRRIAVARPAPAQATKHPYVVHFHSGLTQPADSVIDKDPHYYIEISNRTFSVSKDLVRSIEKVM